MVRIVRVSHGGAARRLFVRSLFSFLSLSLSIRWPPWRALSASTAVAEPPPPQYRATCNDRNRTSLSSPSALFHYVPVLNIDGGRSRLTYLGYSETRGACVLDGSRRAVSDGRPAIKDR